MTHDRLLRLSERWFTLLQRLYPADFREEMGTAVVEAYVDRARAALKSGGPARVAMLWIRAFVDSMRNGLAERVRPATSWRRGGNWGRDVELVTRRLVRAPAFAVATVGTLAVGLGMFAVVYTATQKILIDPMPYENPGDLYFVWSDYRPVLDLSRGPLSGPHIAELQKAGGVIEDAAGLQRFLGGIFAMREGSEPIEIAVTLATPNIFELLGVSPALGRGFLPNEAGPGSQVIVLTHKLWTRIGADPSIIGSVVRLQGRPFTVIGVLPADFAFVRNEAIGPPQHIDAYIPFETNLAAPNSRTGGVPFSGLIRAHVGTRPEVVAAAVDAVDARDFHGRRLKLYPVGLRADVISRIRPALLVLSAAGLVLLFMLMVNLGSVLLARAAQREHEVAVSRALGANTIRIIRSTLLEGAMLGAAGGALGTLAAIWGTRALVALAPLDLPRRETIAVDWRIALVIIVVGGLLGLLAASVQASWSARTSLSSLMASSGVRGGGGHGRLRRGMIVAQVAFSLVLLTSGALVVRSFERLLAADPGFNPNRVLTVRVRTPLELFPQPADVVGFHDRVEHELAALPGVTGASASSALPLTAAAGQMLIQFPGAPGNRGDADRDRVLVDMVAARADYMNVMGMRVVAGRTFERTRRDSIREALIDSGLARQFFPAGNAIGATMTLGDDLRALTIAGVFDQARMYEVHRDGRPQILVRAEDTGSRALFFVARTSGDPRALFPSVRTAVRAVDPRVAVGDERTMDEIVSDTLRREGTSAALLTAFAIGALLLAAMGLFAVVSGSVTRRRHELAVRLALGADQGRVLRLVLREGVLLVTWGLLIGAPGSYMAGGLIRGALVGVSPSDPLTLIAVALGLLIVTMVTCYIPARRALGIEPSQLLRHE